MPRLNRVLPALDWRIRLIVLRCKHGIFGASFGHAKFGARCQVRRGLHLVIHQGACVEIGADCILDRDTTIEVGSGGVLAVGARVIFGHHCTIGANEKIEIGDDALLAEMVSIRDHDHRFDDLSTPIREQGAVCAPVAIGRDVWIGAKATVVKGVTVGDGAVVGANAVVTHDMPPHAIVGGIPARVIKMRGA
jgi:acetyltransferase-like isoleucine patch superfamily enzyme